MDLLKTSSGLQRAEMGRGEIGLLRHRGRGNKPLSYPCVMVMRFISQRGRGVSTQDGYKEAHLEINVPEEEYQEGLNLKDV